MGVDSRRTESVSSRREGNEHTRRVDSRRTESTFSRRERDESTRRVDSRRIEFASSRREGDEPTRRVDSRRTESVSSRREGEEQISITFITQKGTIHRRAHNELIRKQVEHIRGQHVSGEGKHDPQAINEAIQDTKRESEAYIFSGQKMDGAEQDVTFT